MELKRRSKWGLGLFLKKIFMDMTGCERVDRCTFWSPKFKWRLQSGGFKDTPQGTFSKERKDKIRNWDN